MSLQFILGGSGSGKSTALYRDFISNSIKEPDRSFYLCVPDQFTMQTQKDIVSMHPDRGILNLDILSFGRLTYRAFRDQGVNRPILDDTGKNLILRHLAGEHKEELPMLSSKLSKEGFIHEVKSVLSEFMQYGISPEGVEELKSAAAGHGSLKAKLSDLQVLYKAFRGYLGEHYLTSEEALNVLCRIIPKLEFLRGSVLAFDGFTGFTPIQLKVVEGLLKVCSRVVVVLTVDPAAAEKTIREEELFCLSKKTRELLEAMAFENGIEREQDILLTKSLRFTKSKELETLEKQLFRGSRKETPPQSGGYEDIRIAEYSNPAAELRDVCRQIRALTREGCQYRDMAIILGDMEPYRDWIDIETKVFGIPCFLDETNNLRMNPLVELSEGALEILSGGFQLDAVLRFLRSGISSFSLPEADRLELYMVAYGLRGRKAYENAFVYTKKLELSAEELQELNALRERLLSDLGELLAGPGTDTAASWCERLYSLFVRVRAEEKLAAYAKAFEERGESSSAMEYSQVYRYMIDLLDQIHSLLGEEKLNAREFLDILSSGISEIRIGRIPQNVDRVLIGDMERTRLAGNIKILFFLGAGDANIPKSSAGGGLLSQLDRELLLRAGYELSPSGRQLQFTQRLYLYMNLTRPMERLFLSWYRVDGEGSSVRPSYLVSELRSLFPGIPLRRPEEEERIESIETAASGRTALAESLRKEDQGLLRYFYAKWDPALYRKLLKAACLSYREHPLPTGVSLQLFGPTLHTSISRLEAYSGCPYAHFLRYGLKLRERSEADYSAVDTGTVLHAALQMIPGYLEQEGYTLRDFPDELPEKLVPPVIRQICDSYGEALFSSTARNSYLITQFQRILVRSLKAFRNQLSKGVFREAFYELEVRDMGEDPIYVPVSGSNVRLTCHGRIDRADIAETEEGAFLKIVDYKTGAKKFRASAVYEGIELQLPVYMEAAIGALKEKFGGRLAPGGMFYLPVQDPVMSVETVRKQENAWQKSYMPSGLIRADQVKLFDESLGAGASSEVVPAGYKKDGSFTATSGVADKEEFAAIGNYGKRKVKELGSRILSGEIPLQPLRFQDRTPCMYCEFRKACGFDIRIPGCRERVSVISDREAMAKMKELMTQGNEQEADATGPE